jgi:hypothetical protein
MIGNNDLWIAAHAKAAGLILVTNNEREFRSIHGLEIQNWADRSSPRAIGLPAPHNSCTSATPIRPEMLGIADPRQLHGAGPRRRSLD